RTSTVDPICVASASSRMETISVWAGSVKTTDNIAATGLRICICPPCDRPSIHCAGLHGVNDGLDSDLHFVADAEHQGARVLHAPLYVRHLERCANVVQPGYGIHRG